MLYKRILGASPLTSTSYLHAIKIFYWIAHSVQKKWGKNVYSNIYRHFVLQLTKSRTFFKFP